MRKRTTIELDMELLIEARAVLGTKGIDETVHAALREVVNARRRLGLLDLEPDLTLQDLVVDRHGRS